MKQDKQSVSSVLEVGMGWLRAKLIRISNFLLHLYVPRWVILLIEMIIVFFSIKMAFYLISTITREPYYFFNIRWEELVMMGVQLIFFFVFKSFYGLIRYSSLRDAGGQFFTVAIAVLVLLIINQVHYFNTGTKLILNAGLAIYGVFAFSLLFLFQISVKEMYSLAIGQKRVRRNYFIYGTDPEEVAIASALLLRASKTYNIAGFITEFGGRSKNTILNLPIYTPSELQKKRINVEAIIIGHNKLQRVRNRKENPLNQLLEGGVRIYKIPRFSEWHDVSKANFQQLEEINVEDLLPRFPINLERKELFDIYADKVILVTGAAGSIGSEIVRQVITFRPRKLVLVDQAETPMHGLSLEIQKEHPEIDYVSVIGDVRDEVRMQNLFEAFGPEVVFHAAAYKHVPLMETNFLEALNVNYRGTRNVALLSGKFGVDRFVFVSTDKAVNPTNVMGASKRSAEILIQYLAKKKDFTTRFITTRFGNVLGSNGSVVPLFQRQIAAGGPVTVTHPDINRFFMTIDEACQLVLIAAEMGHGGEIFVFDMGSPVKIDDLAKKMIKMAGLKLDEDIKIEYTGLRPGEKLYEEVLADKEKTLPTQQDKILIANGFSPFEEDKTEAVLSAFLAAIQTRDCHEAYTLLQEMVPEYRPDAPQVMGGVLVE